MADVFMTDPATGRCALYTEPNLTGDPKNPNSPRNAPLNNPTTNLASLYYHSDYDPIEVIFGPTNVTIVHPTIPAGVGPGGQASINGQLNYGNYNNSILLYTHSLGYAPDFMVTIGNQTVHPGYPVQYSAADGRMRCITAYATTSGIYLYEFGAQTSSALASTNVTYTVLVFKRLPTATGNILMDFNPTTGVLKMARDKFSSDRRYLQIIPGGSPFAFPLGRTIDLANGTFRSVQPDGTIRDVVPAIFQLSFGRGGPSYGPSGNYNGSFTGDPSISVQAP